jgi:hypothetical protein
MWTKDLSKIRITFESIFCIVQNMHIAKEEEPTSGNPT